MQILVDRTVEKKCAICNEIRPRLESAASYLREYQGAGE